MPVSLKSPQAISLLWATDWFPPTSRAQCPHIFQRQLLTTSDIIPEYPSKSFSDVIQHQNMIQIPKGELLSPQLFRAHQFFLFLSPPCLNLYVLPLAFPWQASLSLHQFHLPREVISGPLDHAELLPPPDQAFLISLSKHISPLPSFTALLTARSLAYLCLLFVHGSRLLLQSKLSEKTPSWFSYVPVAITEELLKDAGQVTWAAASLSLRSGVCWAKGHSYLITVSVTGHLLLPPLSKALFNIVCAFPSLQSLPQQVPKALPLPPHCYRLPVRYGNSF